MSDIEIEIDGKILKAAPNSMIIQVADAAGIYIPRFCYHKLLSIAANCRMCLVEVEKSPKPLPACATPVTPGMKVLTRSKNALAAQRSVMEFLLINHPLDCPIYDQGGECELQDLSMGYGSSRSYYHEGKRSVKDKNIGPLISTEMTRCIQCTRCVRFGDEVAGLRELGATGRGENMEIGTYIQHVMHSEVSGNIIDLCPVGALTSKPFRFTARAWELTQASSIAPHDCVGSNISVHTRDGRVMRAVPRENISINETWISDRDRYSYEALYHPDRVTQPWVRFGQEWREVDWQTAFERISIRLQAILQSSGAESIGALLSPSATTEEYYLMQKLMRSLGSHHIDHRLRQVDFSDQESMPSFPGVQGLFSDLETYERIILIGSYIQKEQPALALRIRKASLKQAEVIALNMMDYRFHFKLSAKKITAPHLFVASLKQMLGLLDRKIVDDPLVERLLPPKKTAILLGASAFHHPEAASIRKLAHQLADKVQGTVHFLTEGANAAGAWMAGAVPHRLPGAQVLSTPGLDAMAMLEIPRKAYFLFNVEPDLDCANPVVATNALRAADFVVSLSSFKNRVIEETAEVILPLAPFSETSGTYVNAAGTWQSFQGVAQPLGAARPGWKIIRVLGNVLHREGFEYTSSEEVLKEFQVLFGMTAIESLRYRPNGMVVFKEQKGFSRIGDIPLYSIDSIVRRGSALQSAQAIMEGDVACVRLHPETAATLPVQPGERLTLIQGGASVSFPVQFDIRVPREGIFVPGGVVSSAGLPELFGTLTIQKA